MILIKVAHLNLLVKCSSVREPFPFPQNYENTQSNLEANSWCDELRQTHGVMN